MRLADISPAQEADIFPSPVNDHDILISVRLLLPTIVVRGRESRPHGEVGQVDRSPGEEVGDMPVAETLRDLRALESRMSTKVCAAGRGVESLTSQEEPG